MWDWALGVARIFGPFFGGGFHLPVEVGVSCQDVQVSADAACAVVRGFSCGPAQEVGFGGDHGVCLSKGEGAIFKAGGRREAVFPGATAEAPGFLLGKFCLGKRGESAQVLGTSDTVAGEAAANASWKGLEGTCGRLFGAGEGVVGVRPQKGKCGR